MNEDKNLEEQIAERLQETRRGKGLTQEKAAEALGMNWKTYSKYERGENEKIPLEVLFNMSEKLDISMDYLITGNPSLAPGDLETYVHLLQGKSDAEKKAGFIMLSAFFEAVAILCGRE